MRALELRAGVVQGAGLDEAAVIRRVMDGETEEFRHLVLSHKDAVYGLILRQVGERTVAEDLAQETFIRAFRSIRQFRFESSFGTWLTRIALNQASSYFASRRYKQQRRTDEFNPEVHDMKADGPHQELEKKERLRCFRAALGALSPKFREVMTLCGLEGKSYEEAAEILAVPVGTIRSRLNKARLVLKALFCEEQGGEAANES